MDTRAKLAGLIHTAEFIVATVGLVGWIYWVVSDERRTGGTQLPPLPAAQLDRWHRTVTKSWAPHGYDERVVPLD